MWKTDTCDFIGCHHVPIVVYVQRTSLEDVGQWSSLRPHVFDSSNKWTEQGEEFCVMP